MHRDRVRHNLRRLREATFSGIGGTASGSEAGLANATYTVPLGAFAPVFPPGIALKLKKLFKKTRKRNKKVVSEALVGAEAGRPRAPHELQQYKDPLKGGESEDENRPSYKPSKEFLSQVRLLKKRYGF